MEFQPALQTFIAESRELLGAMEAALLALEKNPADADTLQDVFRAAHTIKGSAGVFGLDAVVEFAHAMENVLADVRAGEVEVDGPLVALLLSCGDHCAALIDGLLATEPASAERLQEAGATLVGQLRAYLAEDSLPLPDGPPGGASLPEPVPLAPLEPEVESMNAGTVQGDTWHISLRFGTDVLRHGMDPASFVRYLSTLGEIQSVTPIFDSMPAAADMDPESCYLGLEIDFRGDVDKESIENVFEFVQDDCAIRILPPGSKVLDYIRLIEELPEDRIRLGEILVSSGVLTRRELEQGLLLQERLDASDGTAAPAAEHKHKLGRILVGQGVVQDELVSAALEKQRILKQNRAQESSFVRVRADKLDELINLVGELVIASSGVGMTAKRTRHGEMLESAATLDRLVEEVRDGALKLRMVPIGETFGRFGRVVRDLGHELGKEVELVLSGTDTELDKSMVEKISDPLMHLVRNALDHGIEAAAEREKHGKPARGRLWLNAYHESGSIVIEVADDGRGLDRRKIMQRAVERGLISPDQAPGDRELFRLVMEAGFSTADEVTSVSGRGVGMDVVRRNVEALRGAITIDSAEGEGTTIALRLPLTLAIIDGFAVGVGDSAYVLPLEMVVECLELSGEERTRVRESGYINLRGQVLPLLRLREAFGARGEAGKRENIVVVQYGGQQAGFAVDTLLGEFQTVIKPLGRLFRRLSGISGSTILGSGEVALILDVQALVTRAIGTEAAREARAAEPRSAEKK